MSCASPSRPQDGRDARRRVGGHVACHVIDVWSPPVPPPPVNEEPEKKDSCARSRVKGTHWVRTYSYIPHTGFLFIYAPFSTTPIVKYQVALERVPSLPYWQAPSLHSELVQFLEEPIVSGSLVAGPLLVDTHPAHGVGPRRVLGADKGVCARAELLFDEPREQALVQCIM